MRITFSKCLAAAFLFIWSQSATAQAPAMGGGLHYFISDESLWSLPAAELPAKLQPAGYTVNASTGVVTLGEPRDMLKRKAVIFTDDIAVWKATLTQGAALRTVTFDLLPPATLAKVPDKSGFRTLTKRIEERLTAAMKSAPALHPYDADPPAAGVKVTCQRWIGKTVQAVFVTSCVEARGVFTPQRIELKIMAAAAPGKPSITKVPAAKPDKTTGAVVLEGMPAQPEWEGSHPHWLVLEQALHATGRSSDRNGIIECYAAGPSWATQFVICLQRIAQVSGAKITAVVPMVHQTAELARLAKSCETAAKKLGKTSPQKLESFLDVDSDVLRLARTGGNSLPQFTASIKQAIGAGRPLVWYGWRGIYGETPAAEGSPAPVLRLISGFDPIKSEVVFADAAGQPDRRMKLADALAASFYVADLSGK